MAEFTAEFATALQPMGAEEAGAGAVSAAAVFEVRWWLLREFLSCVPRGLRSAFEFRHASWFCDEVYEVMRGANVALCQAESEKLETPEVQTADFAYLRLRKEDYSKKAQAAVKAGWRNWRLRETCLCISSMRIRRRERCMRRSCWGRCGAEDCVCGWSRRFTIFGVTSRRIAK